MKANDKGLTFVMLVVALHYYNIIISLCLCIGMYIVYIYIYVYRGIANGV